ncbi:MAG: PAS domain S-box protein [Heteroscytonema crispum UTEX LB 1556]
MSEFWTNFFSSAPFIPHGHCYLWKPGLVWLHLSSDAFIALAYFSIPITLFYFVRKRQDLPFNWIFLLFAAFIVACGTTHIMGIWTLWHPTYWLSGSIKAVTATVSCITSVNLIYLIPQALALPSPAQLQQANQQLQAQIAERQRIEEELRKYQNHLEFLVTERTNEITQSNEQLQQEIVERQRILSVLRRSEERYRSLIEATSQIIWHTSPEGELVTEQPGWSAFTGQTYDEFRGWGWLNAIHPDDQAHTAQMWSTAVANGTSYEVEHRLRRYDGEYRDMSVRGIPILEGDGSIREWIGVHTDISDRKRAEEALRQSEERYRYLAEAIPQLVWTTDADGQCNYVNQKLCEYTGLTFEEVKGEAWLLAIHPDDLQPSHEVWINALQSGCFYQDEYRFRRGFDGSYRWHLIRGVPLKDEYGNVVKWFGTCTDIHEQKQIEVERARLLELEKTARAKAEEANRIKDEFLAVLSHELRTPLNPILGWSRILQSRKLDEKKIAQATATIERNAKLQLQLIEDLLDVSRILQGKLPLNIANVNLKSIILAALETRNLAVEAKSIQVTTILPENVGQVAGDSTRLQQVVWNLLSNAVKFTPNGGRIEVKLAQVDSYAQITVSDTGKGISAEFLPFVFDYFRQADSSTTRKFGGLGLGLALVRNIVEMHGGTVAAESLGENQGAKFIVCLPLLVNEKPSITSEENYSSFSASDSLTLAGVQILVVDDEPDSLDYIAFVLEQEGASVITVSSGIEALQVIIKAKPDILISDIGMPDMNGYELMRQVRNLAPENKGEIKAIALTAFAGNGDRQQVLKAGFGMHISKPVNPEDLVAAVVKLIDQQQ